MSRDSKITTSEFGEGIDLELPDILLDEDSKEVSEESLDLTGDLGELLGEDANKEDGIEDLTGTLESLLNDPLNLLNSTEENSKDDEELLQLSYETSRERLKDIARLNRLYDSTTAKRSNKVGRLINKSVKEFENKLIDISESSVKPMSIESMENSSKLFKELLKTEKQTLLSKRIQFQTFNELKDALKLNTLSIELMVRPEIVKQSILELVNNSLQTIVAEYIEQESVVDITQSCLMELEDSNTILTPVTTIIYNSLNQSQKVVCPICGEVSHNIIRFTRGVQNLKMNKPKQLFLHTPLICKCGNVYALTEAMCSDLNKVMEISLEMKASKIKNEEILVPYAEELARLPFIKVESDADWRIEEELSHDYYKEFMKHNCLVGMKRVLVETFDGKDNKESRDRFNLLKDNIFKKFNLNDDSIRNFLYSNGVIKTLVRHQQDIKNFESKLLFADRVINSLKVATKEIILEDDSRELSETLRFLNNAIPALITGKYTRLSEKNYVSRSKLYLNSMQEYLDSMAQKLEDLKRGEKYLKEFYLKNYIDLSIPQTEIIRSYNGPEIYFESKEELDLFFSCACEGLVYSLWVNFIFNEEINRLQRGNYAIASYYTNAELQTTKKAMKTTAKYKEIDLEVMDNLENYLNCCGSESAVVRYSESKNNKYNYIYKLHEICNTLDHQSKDRFLYDCVMEWLADLDTTYSKLESLSTGEQSFVDLCILYNLGFNETELKSYIQGSAVIDSHSIAIRKDNQSLEDYLANYDKAPRYIPDFLSLDYNEIVLTCRLYLDNIWSTWNKSRNYHNKVRGAILEYAINEVNYDTNIFNYCNMSTGVSPKVGQYILIQDLNEGESIRKVITREMGTSSLLLKNMTAEGIENVDDSLKDLVDLVSFKEQNWSSPKLRFLCAIKMLYSYNRGEDMDNLTPLLAMVPDEYNSIVTDYSFILMDWKYKTSLNMEALMLSREEVLDHYKDEIDYIIEKVVYKFIPSEKIEFKRLIKSVWGYDIEEV